MTNDNLIVLPNNSRTQDQEAGIVNRAKEEATLMQDMQGILHAKTEQERLDTKKRVKKLLMRSGSASSSGFGVGGGKATKKSKVDKSEQTIFNGGKLDDEGHGALIVDEGVVRINQVMSPETASEMREYINKQLLESEKEVADGTAPSRQRFANVLVKKGRWDLLLPLEEPSGIVQKSLAELLQPEGPVCKVLKSVLGKKAELYEWASLISDPGSDRQVIHPDIPYESRDASLLTCFFALQDVEADMGATVYMPGTHSKEHHAQNRDNQERDELLKTTPNSLALLKTGDCSIYDPRVLHAGGANESKSNTRRVICYFTFRNPNLPDPRSPNNPGSIREDIKQRNLSLPEIQRMLDII
jgi:ectoine hydroxylase-related dioxygenase (phytanoyl-CoA dioxygenase family)